jgi:hypothetical protein
MTDQLTFYDVCTDENRPATQADIDQMQRHIASLSAWVSWDIDTACDQDYGFKLAVYPSRGRPDLVYVAEDKAIEPYPGIKDVMGRSCYPDVPRTKFSLRSGLAPGFAAEIVRRWNAYK